MVTVNYEHSVILMLWKTVFWLLFNTTVEQKRDCDHISHLLTSAVVKRILC